MKSSPLPIAIRVIDHNIRYATGRPFKGEEDWVKRKSKLIAELRFHTLYNPESFICLQEVLHNQLLDVLTGLNAGSSLNSPSLTSESDAWSYIGIGRDDGKEAGEYSPIFYRPSIWKLEHFETIWLSETPEKPSKGWDAASTRILTVGVFQHYASRKRLVVMNTHLDDQGSQSRCNAAKLIVKAIHKHTFDGNGRIPLPIVLTGDFNSQPHQEAYQILNDQCSPISDVRGLVAEGGLYGHENTFTGFGFGKEPMKRIDFVFVGPRDSSGNDSNSASISWQVSGYAVLESRFEDGIYNSDHRAVVADLLLTA